MKTAEPSKEVIEPKEKLLAILLLIVSSFGLVVSFYTAWHHFTLLNQGHTDFACNINAQLNCDAVAQSEYSHFLGIPQPIWGISVYIAIMTLAVLALIIKRKVQAHKAALVILIATAVLGSCVLGYLSLFVIKALCISCMLIYTSNFLLLGLVLFFRQLFFQRFQVREIVDGLLTTLIIMLLVIGLYFVLKPTLIQAPSSPHDASTTTPGEDLQDLDNSLAQLLKIHKTEYSGSGIDYRKGPDNAKVIIHEFADFQCPACRRASEVLSKLHNEFPNDVLIVFRNFPLDPKCNPSVQAEIHPYACRAAVLARCAGEIGQFWRLHDMIFKNQSFINDQTLDLAAKAVGLNEIQIKKCLEAKDIVNKIADDVMIATKLNVNETPTLFINNKKYKGPISLDTLRQVVFRELGQ